MWYREGTISIDNGSSVVTGTNTYWEASIVPGDSLLVNGKQYEIASVQSNTQLTLVDVFSDASVSNVDYAIIIISTTSTGLASRILNVSTIWQRRENEIAEWQAGTIDGGPNSDGRYPLTAPDGSVKYALCPVAIAAMASAPSDWADYPEDVEIPGFPGRYSSMHWANKSEDAAILVSESEALLSPHYASIDSILENIADISAVAGMSGDITAVIADAADIGTVAGMSADIATIIADAADIGAVALNSASVNTVATNITNVNSVGANITNVNTVAGMAADITTVIADSADIDAVATNITNVNTVAGMTSDITAVIADASDIGVVATNISNVTSVAGMSANIASVVADAADISTVAGMSADIDTVILNLADIQDASNQAALAQAWASAGENVLVDGVGYSAYHWATQAADLVTEGILDDLTTSAVKTWSSTKITSELGNYEPADATILKDADIGVSVQGYNASTVVDASYVHTDNNYTTIEKSKLAGIAEGADVNVQSDWNAATGDAFILNKPTLGTASSMDSTAFETAGAVTTHETTYDHTSYQETLVSGTNIKTINSQSLLGTGDLVIETGSTFSVGATYIVHSSKVLDPPAWVKGGGGVSTSDYPLLAATGLFDPYLEELPPPDTALHGDPSSLAFSSDGEYLAAGISSIKIVNLYKLSNGITSKLSDISLSSAINNVSFSNNDNYLAVGTSSQGTKMYNRVGDVFTELSFPTSTANVIAHAFSQDDTYYAHTRGTYVDVYKREGNVFLELTSLDVGGIVRATRFHPQGGFLAVGHDGSPYVSIYKQTGDSFTLLDTFTSGLSASATYLKFTSDGGGLFCVSSGLHLFSIEGNSFTKSTFSGTIYSTGANPIVITSDAKYLLDHRPTSPWLYVKSINKNTLTLADTIHGITFSNEPTKLAVSTGSEYLALRHSASPYVRLFDLRKQIYLPNFSITGTVAYIYTGEEAI